MLPFVQLIHGLDVSKFVPKVSADMSPCKSCKILIQSFEKVKKNINHNFVNTCLRWKCILGPWEN